MKSLSKSPKINIFPAVLLLAAPLMATPSLGQQLQPAARLAGQPKHAAPAAHASYSVFDSAGVTSISCEGAVDWETLFAGRTNASFRQQVLPVLNETRFLVTVEKSGTVTVATRASAPADPEAEARADRSIQSFRGVIATVLEGWARFAVAADLPASTRTYKLDNAGDHYLATFKNGPADVAVALDRSFALREARPEVAPGSRSGASNEAGGSIPGSPRLTTPQGGLRASSWSVVFPPGKGTGLWVDARYMQVDGVEVPAEMVLHSSLPSFGEITLPLVLANYQFQR